MKQLIYRPTQYTKDPANTLLCQKFKAIGVYQYKRDLFELYDRRLLLNESNYFHKWKEFKIFFNIYNLFHSICGYLWCKNDPIELIYCDYHIDESACEIVYFSHKTAPYPVIYHFSKVNSIGGITK